MSIASMIGGAFSSSSQAGAMLNSLQTVCLIDSYLFETRDVGSVEHEKLFGWTKHDRIGNHPKRQATGKWDENITINGKLLVKSVHALDSFESIAENKEPVRITFGTGESYKVVIESISRKKLDFIQDGHFVKQEFKVKISRFWE